MKKLIRNVRIKHVLLLMGCFLGAAVVCLLGAVYFVLFLIARSLVGFVNFILWICDEDTISIEKFRIENILSSVGDWMDTKINKNLSRVPPCSQCVHYTGPFVGKCNCSIYVYDYPGDPSVRLMCFKSKD